MNREELLQIGVITKTHGIRGEVTVFPMTDDVRRFKKLKRTILDTGSDLLELECESAKFFKKYVILKFKDHDTIESIQPYVKKGLFVTRADAVKTGKDEYFIADLIGCTATDEAKQVSGTITEVIQTGANDVYVIDTGNGQLLLPAIKQCVLDVDIESHTVKIHILDGLMD
ncbi:MAG: 16S rRNA processing protein RimM [Lachnospiraceae bacterium]|nr:16S rRNA processing protein RimM [Lachnospiraceae bacterium]MBR4573840.1 16S rRNA processing protein RimM [Lachnospiraceae bacterium]